jgi:hypothetical protein
MTTLSFLICPDHLQVGKQVLSSPSFTSQPLSDAWLGSLDTQHFIQIRHADMLHRSSTGAYSPRWKTVSVYLTDNEFCHTGLLEAFNQRHPEASVLNVFWNNEAVAQYRCTEKTCRLNNFERLINNAPISRERASADFFDTSVEQGTKKLWSNLYFAGIDPALVSCFEAIESGSQYLPLQDDIQIHTDSETRVAYLDWTSAVIKNFDALIQFSRETA